MTDIEKLLAIEAIRKLKSRYFFCLDTKDWAGYEQVFTSDAVMDARQAFVATLPGSADSTIFGKKELLEGFGGDDWIMTGAATIIAGASGFFQTVSTVHHGYMEQIDVLSSEHATGVWAMEDVLRFPEGSPIRRLHGFGHYHERYVHVDGRWHISHTKLTRLRIDVE